jgi:Flp pilus assembly protein TadG
MSPSSRYAGPRALARRLTRDERGQELVELVMILPILLLMILGIMEMGHAYNVTHALTGLSREGANLAARGTTLPQVAQIITDNGDDIDLENRGGTIATRIVIQGGTPVVVDQAVHGSVGASKVGVVGGPTTALGGATVGEGQVLYAVEVYYAYTPLTPLAGVMGRIIPNGFYERAVF